MSQLDEAILATASAIFASRTDKTSTDQYITALVLGHPGTGKTSLAATCPTPVLIDSFDPKGTLTKVLQPGINRGDILVRNYESDRWKKPVMFKQWENDFKKLQDTNFFDHIGTYILDSFTGWSKFMMYEIIRMNKSGQNAHADNTPAQAHYKTLLYTTLEYINQLTTLPCHTLMMAHVNVTQDAVTGAQEVSLLAPPSMKNDVPSGFCEKWFTRVLPGKDGGLYKLQIKNDGKWRASSRICGPTKDAYEEPDVRKLLRKYGVNAENKPRLIGVGG